MENIFNVAQNIAYISKYYPIIEHFIKILCNYWTIFQIILYFWTIILAHLFEKSFKVEKQVPKINASLHEVVLEAILLRATWDCGHHKLIHWTPDAAEGANNLLKSC